MKKNNIISDWLDQYGDPEIDKRVEQQLENTETQFQWSPVQLMVVSPPDYVGGYRIGKEFEYSIQFNLAYKPKRIHRFFMRICLGLCWFDKN